MSDKKDEIREMLEFCARNGGWDRVKRLFLTRVREIEYHSKQNRESREGNRNWKRIPDDIRKELLSKYGQ